MRGVFVPDIAFRVRGDGVVQMEAVGSLEYRMGFQQIE